MKSPLTLRVLLALKICISVAIFWWIAVHFDMAAAARHVTELSIPGVAALFLALFAQIGVASHRLNLSLRLLNVQQSIKVALDATIVGGFFSQTITNFVAGDALRLWRLVQGGAPLRAATAAIFLDRALGLLALMLMVLAALLPLLGYIRDPSQREALLLIAAAGAACCAGFGLMALVPQKWREIKRIGLIADLASVGRFALAQPLTGLRALLESILTNALNVVAIWILAQDLGVNVSLWQALVVVPPVILLAMMPFSIAGWGVREGAMVVAFHLIDLPADRAITVSVLFGLSMMAAYLPGGFVWILRKKTAAGNADTGIAPRSP